MNAIWKFTLEVADRQNLQMPEGAKILTAQLQGNYLNVWAQCDPLALKQRREIEVFGTGHPMDEAQRSYISTVQIGPIVFHVFERIS